MGFISATILFEIPLDILSYGVVGFCRKLIGLDSLSHEFLVYHRCDDSKINELNECVNKVGKCFKIKIVDNRNIETVNNNIDENKVMYFGKAYENLKNIACSL